MVKVINLNSREINPLPLIKKEDILERYSELELFRLYIPTLKRLGVPIISPLREESNPSFSVFSLDKGKTYYFKDHGAGTKGDIFEFLKLLYGESFTEVLSRLCVDLQLENEFRKPCAYILPKESDQFKKKTTFVKQTKIEGETSKKHISIEKRKWNSMDLEYWKQYGIKLSTLSKFNVYPIQAYSTFYENAPHKKYRTLVDEQAYAFEQWEELERFPGYKIYQPFAGADRKWRNTISNKSYHGHDQLSEGEHELVILTKSLKDVMAIYDVTGFPAVSMQSESSIPTAEYMEFLQNKFINIFIFYDNDFKKDKNFGQEQATKILNSFPNILPLINIKIPNSYNAKDFSDFVKTWGRDYAKRHLTKEIKLKKYPF